MIRTIEYTPLFKKGVKRAKKKNFNINELESAIQSIVKQNNELLKRKYKDHSLQGSHKGLRELHIQADWLLIYKIVDDECLLLLLATGSHDDVFRKTR